MAFSSQITQNSTITPTQSSTPSLIETETTPSGESSFQFDAFFRKTYPGKTTLGPSGKRKTKGSVIYQCLHCPESSPWKNLKRDNAVYHAKRKHANIIAAINGNTTLDSNANGSDQPAKQRRLDHFYCLQASDSSLRRAFNRQRYIEAMVGLLTRRRLPFSAVTWDEMAEIMLAANPAIEDLLLTSRMAAMRHITANFNLY